MPEPDIVEDTGVLQDPHTPTEILGRGEDTRQAKTYLEDGEIADILSHIAAWSRSLIELFRKKHARENTVAVKVEQEDGSTVTEHRPEILTDDQVRQIYPVVRKWERMHREQVLHRASTEGFTVTAAAGMREDDEASTKDRESSAGADAPTRSKNGQQDANPRWR